MSRFSLILMAFAACGSSGCKMMCGWMPQASFCQQVCVLEAEAPMSEIVAHLNANISRVDAWQSTELSITASKNGIPLMMSGNIAVASPRNFRLSAGLLGSTGVDIGSNNDQLWFSSQETDGRVLTVGHDDIGRVQHRLPIPFQPDWVISALGVIPLDEREYSMSRYGSNGTEIHLVAKGVTPTGEAVQRLIIVDGCRGVVMAHALYDAQGTLIAKASFSDHQVDAVTGAILAHRIRLEWPKEKVNLSMKMGQIEVNPSILPNWDIPRNQEVINLSHLR